MRFVRKSRALALCLLFPLTAAGCSGAPSPSSSAAAPTASAVSSAWSSAQMTTNRRNKRCHDLRQGFHHPGIPCVRPENDDQPACRIRHQGRARDHRQAVNRFGVPERGAF